MFSGSKERDIPSTVDSGEHHFQKLFMLNLTGENRLKKGNHD
jgi:hypothetical protein